MVRHLRNVSTQADWHQEKPPSRRPEWQTQWISRQNWFEFHLGVLSRTCSHTDDGGNCLMKDLQRALESDCHATECTTWTLRIISHLPLTGTKPELMMSLFKRHLCPIYLFPSKQQQFEGPGLFSFPSLVISNHVLRKLTVSTEPRQ